MMENVSNNQSFAGRTVLVAPSAGRDAEFLIAELEHRGARVLNWPELEIGAPDSYMALDEAIENLFGYDWIIFRNIHAVEYFLGRFYQLGHQTNELDNLRICAIGAAASGKLQASQIHVDLVPAHHRPETVVTALGRYVRGQSSLRALNLLIPRAIISADPLPLMLETTDARVDVIFAYRTAAANDSALAQLNALLAGGGIDCVAFTGPEEIQTIAQLFDTNDLSRLLADTVVACVTESVALEGAEFSLSADIIAQQAAISAFARTIASYFSE